MAFLFLKITNDEYFDNHVFNFLVLIVMFFLNTLFTRAGDSLYLFFWRSIYSI